MNQQYGNPEIKQLLDKMWDTHCQKDSDYGGEKSMGNFMKAEKVGVPAWLGAVIRMQDKWMRIINILKRGGEGQVKESRLEKALLKLALDALNVIVLRRKEGQQKAVGKSESLCHLAPPGFPDEMGHPGVESERFVERRPYGPVIA